MLPATMLGAKYETMIKITMLSVINGYWFCNLSFFNNIITGMNIVLPATVSTKTKKPPISRSILMVKGNR